MQLGAWSWSTSVMIDKSSIVGVSEGMELDEQFEKVVVGCWPGVVVRNPQVCKLVWPNRKRWRTTTTDTICPSLLT